jgi:glucose-6-phosphate-specific signal transduction histidine kinase
MSHADRERAVARRVAIGLVAVFVALWIVRLFLGIATGSLSGFDAAGSNSGTGLQGMADRLDAVGGELRIESRPGEGTSLTGRVPVGDPG